MHVDDQIEKLRKLFREEFKLLLEDMKKGEQQAKPPLSILQIANRYDVTKATVHNWLNRGIIVGFKMGKGRFFHLHEVEESLKKYGHLNKFSKAA